MGGVVTQQMETHGAQQDSVTDFDLPFHGQITFEQIRSDARKLIRFLSRNFGRVG